MNTPYQKEIETRLKPDEQLIWSGQPDARQMTRNYVLSGWGFLLLMGVGFLFIGRVDIVLVAAFGLLVMVIILGMGLFIVYPDAQHTVYMLTDQRVLIFGTGRSKFLQEMQAHDIGPIQITERKDGTGDLFFASEVYRISQRRGKASHLGFIAIPQVRTVEQHLRQVFPNTETGK